MWHFSVISGEDFGRSWFGFVVGDEMKLLDLVVQSKIAALLLLHRQGVLNGFPATRCFDGVGTRLGLGQGTLGLK